MNVFAKMPPAARQSALGLIMLALLLAGTAGAWVIVKTRSGPRPGEIWYLVTNADGRPAGWKVIQRAEGGPLGLEGYEVVGGRLDEETICSRWQLDAQASRGKYASAVPLPGGQGVIVTRIDYRKPEVTIRQSLLNQGRETRVGQVRAAVPADYVPEGRLRDIILQVARTGDAFYGTMVLDEQAKLVNLAMEAQDRQARALAGQGLELEVVTQTILVEGLSLRPRRHYVAKDGTIPLIEDLDRDQVERTLTLVPIEEVERLYPTAPAQRAAALDRYGWE